MKVLVTHVPAGAGHEKAAEAVFRALKERHPEVESTLLNGLEGMSPWYQQNFTQGYLDMINHRPQLWGFLYHFADLKGLAWAVYHAHRLSNQSHGRKLEEILLRQSPDALVATHFFAVEVAAFLKTKRRLNSRIIAVITDYLPHSVWIAPGVDFYVVGAEATRQELLSRGIPSEKIRVLGIPVEPKFKERHDRAQTAQRLGVDPGLFTVLVGSGGFGTGPVAEEVSSFRSVKEPVQLLIVAGKNSSLYEKLEELRPSIPHAMKVYRFVDNMHELMDVSDILVTKPGGLTSSEAMVKGLPMVFTRPIPGQETRNARILEKAGVALMARRTGELPQIVRDLARYPERRRRMAEACRVHARPDSCYDIAELAVMAPVRKQEERA